jgi:hypothetical protein
MDGKVGNRVEAGRATDCSDRSGGNVLERTDRMDAGSGMMRCQIGVHPGHRRASTRVVSFGLA